MTCNVAIEYTKEMNTIDFRDEVTTPVCLKAARQIVYELANTTVDGQNHYDLNKFYYRLDHECTVAQDGSCAALSPLARRFIMKALTDNLKDLFVKAIFDYVSPFSQAEMDEGIRGDLMYNTPVKLRAISDKNERLQFVFSADLNLVYNDQDIWQNVKVDIQYEKLPQK